MIDTSKLTPKWLAGFFDGEGSVTFTRDQSLQVVIAQSREDILNAIADYFGFGVVKVNKRFAGHKPECTLRWCGKNAAKVLEVMLPHLIIKHRQAEIGIRMATLMVGRGKIHVPAEIQKERNSLIAKNRSLNASHWSRRPKTDVSNSVLLQEEYIQ